MVEDMIILSADTSSERFSLALLEKGRVIARLNTPSCQRQSSDMLPEIEKLLSNNTLEIKDIGCFCIGLGPGSFTGLRIGVTIMRGMAFTQKKPIIGIPSIDLIACNASSCGNDAYVIIDAKQNKVYARFYRFRKGKMHVSGRIMLLGIDEFLIKAKKTAFFLGDAVKLYGDLLLSKGIRHANLLAEDAWYPYAEKIACLGIDKLIYRGGDNVFSLSPLYIYPKEAQVKSNKKRVSKDRF
jgi:tRNA threonylcarbamoyladenosine biosynthesis protein TsaB